jgi:hypothetical protein
MAWTTVLGATWTTVCTFAGVAAGTAVGGTPRAWAQARPEALDPEVEPTDSTRSRGAAPPGGPASSEGATPPGGPAPPGGDDATSEAAPPTRGATRPRSRARSNVADVLAPVTTTRTPDERMYDEARRWLREVQSEPGADAGDGAFVQAREALDRARALGAAGDLAAARRAVAIARAAIELASRRAALARARAAAAEVAREREAARQRAAAAAQALAAARREQARLGATPRAAAPPSPDTAEGPREEAGTEAGAAGAGGTEAP